MEPTKDQLETLLAAIAHVRLRPGMYWGTINTATLTAFVAGLRSTAHVLGIEVDRFERQLWAERGWQPISTQSVIHVMKNSGVSDEEIVFEQLAVLILSLQQTYDLSGEKVLEIHSGIRQRDENIQTIAAIDNLEESMGISSRESRS